MNKDQVLQKVNEYCNEKSYTIETLTNGFREKFAEHFAKRYPDADENDEAAIANLKFAINSAFSGASLIITDKTNAFTAKENSYKTQIAELNEKLSKKTEEHSVELPEDVQNQLRELNEFKAAEQKRTRRSAILSIAKENIRTNLHESFVEFAGDFDVDLNKEDKAQAEALVEKFQKVMKPSIGNIKPLAPTVEETRDKEALESINPVKVC